MKKKFLSLLVALCLMLTLAPAAFAAYGTLTQVDGVYQIEDAADLVAFAELVNNGTTSANAVLTADINLDDADFFPIGGKAYEGSTSLAYKGTFDGQNFSITNATISQTTNMGIFGFVEGGTVKNLTIDYITAVVTETPSGDEPATAAAIGSIHRGSVSNVTVGENCTVSGQNRTGGVVGSARDGVIITNCVNHASVTGSGMYTGGVVGAAHDMDVSFISRGTPATVTSCYNYGTVTGNTEVGGVVGYTDQTTVSSCHNEGAVNATGNYGCGGIVGFDAYNPRTRYFYYPSKGASISACTNSGAVTGSRSGGIVGTLGVTPGQDQPTSEKTLTVIDGCTNSGAITGTTGKCGAIFGYQITYKNGDGDNYINNLIVQIVNCTNEDTGTVNGEVPSELTSSQYVTYQ